MFRFALCSLAFSFVAIGCSSPHGPAAAYSGLWSADIPVQGACPVAHWDVNVSGNSITGIATNPAGTFPITGTIEESGHGTIKINQMGGTIQFSGNKFTSDYFNGCGPRHAEGARIG